MEIFKFDKKEYNLNDDIVVSGKLSKDKKGLANVYVTLRVVPVGENVQVTMDEVVTNEKGEFKYVFKMPKETEAGKYKIIVHANGEVNKSQELDLTILEEQKEDVKVSFNYTEYTVKARDYIPAKGDLIITTIGLKDEEIKSVTIKSSNTSIVTVNQRPEWPKGGFPKSKTRAFGKAIKSGKASIIATVIDVKGNEYKSECKITVTN